MEVTKTEKSLSEESKNDCNKAQINRKSNVQYITYKKYRSFQIIKKYYLY